MKVLSTSTGSIIGTVTHPGPIAFAFNPLYCKFETSLSINAIKLIVEDEKGVIHSISASLLNGVVNIYFSRIAQLFFDAPLNKRSIEIKIALQYQGVTFFSDKILVLWGGISLGERFAFMGHFPSKLDNRVVTRVWFRRFPFTVSMFNANESCSIHGNEDNHGDKICASYIPDELKYGIFEVLPAEDFPNAKLSATYKLIESDVNNIFDDSFDYTFYSSSIGAESIRLIVSNNQDGYYLRWIDSKGCIQYFLFTSGEISLKTKKSSIVVEADDEMFSSMWFDSPNRDVKTYGEKSCKCCATSIPDIIYEYVSTIITSPYVDLYLGKTSNNKDIWLPINIDAQTIKFNTKENLHDLEISFSLPELNPQSL